MAQYQEKYEECKTRLKQQIEVSIDLEAQLDEFKQERNQYCRSTWIFVILFLGAIASLTTVTVMLVESKKAQDKSESSKEGESGDKKGESNEDLRQKLTEATQKMEEKDLLLNLTARNYPKGKYVTLGKGRKRSIGAKIRAKIRPHHPTVVDVGMMKHTNARCSSERRRPSPQ